MALPKKLWLPNTHKHPIGILDHGALTNVEFVVIHINDGTNAGTLSWWAERGHEADGAQLQIAKSGAAYQTMALNRKAWHAGAANNISVGIEHEGFSRAEAAHRNDSRPRVQMEVSANRAAWIHHECGLGRPKVGKTILPHSHGGAAWGGHTNCPGPWDWDLYEKLAHSAYMTHWGRK